VARDEIAQPEPDRGKLPSVTIYAYYQEGGAKVRTAAADAVRAEPRHAEWLRAMSDPEFVGDTEEFLALAEDADAELDIDSGA